MTGNIQKLPQRMTITQRRRVLFITLIVIEIAFLVFIGIKLVGVEAVEDYTEIVGNQEIVYFRNEITGDPALLALIVLMVVATFASKRLRREPVLLMAVQVSSIGLIVFVLWPLAQVFLEGFRASQSAEGYSLVQFQKLLTTPMVAKATTNTMNEPRAFDPRLPSICS